MASDQELNHWQARCYALVDEKAGLEQQLAEAREQMQHLWDINTDLGNENDKVLEQIEQAKTLLKPLAYMRADMCPFCLSDSGWTHGADCVTTKARAFLASLEATDGK